MKSRKSRRRIGPDEALVVYLSMGQRRSLDGLHRRYRTQTGLIPPSTATLRRWSTRFGWQDRAKEHDIQVASRASEKSIETQATERASVFDGIQDAVRDCLAKLHENLKLVIIKSVEDLDAIAGIVIKLSAHSLDIQRGRQPDPDLVEALVREKLLANGTTDRATAPPTPRELNDAVDRALKEYDEETKH